MYLSIIIPAYNEEKRLGATLSEIKSYMDKKDVDYEVIVVDDGSQDHTSEVAERSHLSQNGRLKILKNGKNMGKGYSFRKGIANSTGEYVLLSDADMSTPTEEAEKLFQYINKGYDIVIGSRGMRDSRVNIRQAWYRELMGRTFNILVRLFVMRGINDTQCGFKLFKGNTVRDLASFMHIDSFCFDVEMLYLAKLKKYKIKEVGVIWRNSPKSKVKIVGSSIKMFFDLLRIKGLHK